jgi:hypothetical protein
MLPFSFGAAEFRQTAVGVFLFGNVAIGPYQTWACAPHMSAFGGKAGIGFLRRRMSVLTQSGHTTRVNRP